MPQFFTFCLHMNRSGGEKKRIHPTYALTICISGKSSLIAFNEKNVPEPPITNASH